MLKANVPRSLGAPSANEIFSPPPILLRCGTSVAWERWETSRCSPVKPTLKTNSATQRFGRTSTRSVIVPSRTMLCSTAASPPRSHSKPACATCGGGGGGGNGGGGGGGNGGGGGGDHGSWQTMRGGFSTGGDSWYLTDFFPPICRASKSSRRSVACVSTPASAATSWS